MVEQIKLIAQQRNLSEISISDIDGFTDDLSQVYSGQIETIRESIYQKKDNLIQLSFELQKIREREAALKQSMQEYKKDISNVLNNAQITQKELNKKKNELKTEKQKLLVYKELLWLQEASEKLEGMLKKSAICDAMDLMHVMDEKCRVLYMGNFYNTMVSKCKLKIKEEFRRIIDIYDGKSFSLKNLKNISNVLRYFQLVDDFKSFFWNFLLKDYFQTIIDSNLIVEANADTFLLKDNHTQLNQKSFIELSTNMIKEISKLFNESDIEITQSEYQNYVDTIIKLCLSIKSEDTAGFEEKTKELIQVTNTTLDFVNLLQGNRVANVLEKSREMLIKGSTLGDVIAEMKRMMKGFDTKGMIKKISILAVVIWKDDPDKLSCAISTLATINTIEAFECAVMFEQAIRNK